ncbi:MAG: hypothetical protein ND895_03905 [Pyrinomonadaceae bacterium]|nr:hypothetical protein [Pyrinomonadaceae bacterium]
MKSTEVYSIVRNILASWCKEHGFRRTGGGMLGWYRPIGDRFILFWFQVSRDGWDEYTGSKFIVEFQISDEPQIGSGHHDQRWRLPKFLTGDQLELIRQLQNRVIAKLEKPNRDYHIFQMPDNVVDWYLAKFKPIGERYSRTDDIWLRYKEKEDVQQWAIFVKEVLGSIVGSLANGAS